MQPSINRKAVEKIEKIIEEAVASEGMQLKIH
jgi:hypothetical protein